MEVLLDELARRDIKNRLIGWFGSYSWASKAASRIQEINDNRLHYTAVGTPVEIKQSLNDDSYAQCVALGKAMAAEILK